MPTRVIEQIVAGPENTLCVRFDDGSTQEYELKEITYDPPNLGPAWADLNDVRAAVDRIRDYRDSLVDWSGSLTYNVTDPGILRMFTTEEIIDHIKPEEPEENLTPPPELLDFLDSITIEKDGG